MRPITGLEQLSIARYMSLMRSASARFSSKLRSSEARIQLMSAPPQNTLPSPASTTARTSSAAAIRAKISCSSAMTPALKAFRTSGRASVTRAMPSSTASRTLSAIASRGSRLHPTGPRARYTVTSMSDAGRPFIYRYAVVTRASHWVWVLAFFVLVGSGLQIFNASPNLDASDKSDPARRVLAIGSPAGGVGTTTALRAHVRHDGLARLDRDGMGGGARTRFRRVDHHSGLPRSRRRPALASVFRVGRRRSAGSRG